MEQIEQIRAAHADTVVYEGAEHGFMRDGSENFHETAAADAWGRATPRCSGTTSGRDGPATRGGQ